MTLEARDYEDLGFPAHKMLLMLREHVCCVRHLTTVEDSIGTSIELNAHERASNTSRGMTLCGVRMSLGKGLVASGR